MTQSHHSNICTIRGFPHITGYAVTRDTQFGRVRWSYTLMSLVIVVGHRGYVHRDGGGGLSLSYCMPECFTLKTSAE